MAGKAQQSGKKRVFNLLRTAGRISRVALARSCALTRPAVSAIVDEMARDGLVVEVGRGDSTGGKPPTLLELVRDRWCAVGIDLGDDYLIRGVLCDLVCNTLYSAELEYRNDADTIVEVTGQLIAQLAARAPAGRLAGAGVAVSGVVDTAANEVVGASTLDVVNARIAERLEKCSGVPVVLERRPNAAALAESLFGAGKEYRTLIYLTSGRGVGAGIMIDGEIYRGSSGIAGELGRLRMPGGGLLEELTRPSAVAAEFSRRKGRECGFADFLRACAAGDPEAEYLAGRNAEELACAAETAANLFDPEAIILGGRALEFDELWFERFKSCFERNSASGQLGNHVAVRKSFFGSSGVAVGGAQVVLDRIIK